MEIKRRLFESSGRDWRDAATTPENLEPPEKLEAAGRVLP